MSAGGNDVAALAAARCACGHLADLHSVAGCSECPCVGLPSFAFRTALAARAADEAETAGQCGAWSGCPLPRGHNMGNADVPENHALHEEPAQWLRDRAATLSDSGDMRSEAVIKAEALREAAHATLSMEYPTSADPDVWGAWLLDRAALLDADGGEGS